MLFFSVTEGHRLRPNSSGMSVEGGIVSAMSTRALWDPLRCMEGGANRSCGISPERDVLTGSTGCSEGPLFTQASGSAQAREKQPLEGAQAPSTSWTASLPITMSMSFTVWLVVVCSFLFPTLSVFLKVLLSCLF